MNNEESLDHLSVAELSLNSGSGKPSAIYHEPIGTARLSVVNCRSGCPHRASTGVSSRSCIHDRVVQLLDISLPPREDRALVMDRGLRLATYVFGPDHSIISLQQQQ